MPTRPPDDPTEPVTVARLALAKHLPEEFLRGEGLRDTTYHHPERGIIDATRIPYWADRVGGVELTDRKRIAMTGDRFRSPQGKPLDLYGRWRIADAIEKHWALIVEGETDCLTAWHAGLGCVGVPGASAWKEEWADVLAPIGQLYVVVEPGQGGDALVRSLASSSIAPTIRMLRLTFEGAPVKDISDLWIAVDRDPEVFEGKVMEAIVASQPLPPPPRREPSSGADGMLALVRDAEARGELDATSLPPPDHPTAVATELVDALYVDESGDLVLRNWRDGWWHWARSSWMERKDSFVRHHAYAFTKNAVYDTGNELLPWKPTRNKIANLLEALAAATYLEDEIDQPTWIDGSDGPSVVSVANGLLDIASRRLIPHTPHYFNQTAVPFDYDPQAPNPADWLAFLAELWPDDPDSIAALQEWFGYVISGRLDQHKILLIVGPTRGGKGTIARIIGKLVGRENVAGPTLSSMAHDFGLQPLLGKSLAVISDARLDAQRDTSVVVERLLSISGEDTITVNRKYRDQWTGKLPTRFLVISNELPRLGDASGTIANRFVVLLLRESWLGREDHGLEDRLSTELPGILNWALEGLDRLEANGRFTRPAATDEAITTLQDLASPVSAFVREKCAVGPTFEVEIGQIFESWKAWAEANGNRPGSSQRFGRDLRAVVPGLRVISVRIDDKEGRVRIYRGLAVADPESPGTRTNAYQPADHEPGGTHRYAYRPNEDRTSGEPADPTDLHAEALRIFGEDDVDDR